MNEKFTQHEFVHALDDYNRITEAVGYEWKNNIGPNLDHSSLLWRILHKKPLYKFPPPTAMSYPWYDLLDKGMITDALVSVADYEYIRQRFGGPALNINQTLWKLDETVEPGKVYLASWPHYVLKVKAEFLFKEHGWERWKVTILENENEAIDSVWKVAKLDGTKLP